MMDEAETLGFAFPTTTSEDLQEALRALVQHETDTQEQTVEEEVVYDFDIDFDARDEGEIL